MIATVFNIDEKQESFLIICFEKDNLERMKQHDPITLESRARGGKILHLAKYPAALSILIAYEEDDVALYKLAKANDAQALLRYLERGRQWRPGLDGVVVNYGKPEGESGE